MGIGIGLATAAITAMFSNEKAFRGTDHLSPVVQVPPLPVRLVSYFFLGVAFVAGFAARLAAVFPGLWVLQVLHMFMFMTSLSVI